MIDFDNNAIKEFIIKEIERGLGKNLTIEEIKNAIDKWNKDGYLSDEDDGNCSKELMVEIDALMKSLSSYRADNDFFINSNLYFRKDREKIAKMIAYDWCIDEDVNFIIKEFLERLLEERRKAND